jgi:hypothetical protein
MPDFDAISAALAARYAAGAMTAPTGYDPIRVATADLPGQMTPLPTVLVFPDHGDFRAGNGTRLGGHDFLVRFYYSQIGDITRDMVALRKWLTVLADQHRDAVQLGGLVTLVTTMSWRIGQMAYAGMDYSGIEFGVHVVTDEGWAATA